MKKLLLVALLAIGVSAASYAQGGPGGMRGGGKCNLTIFRPYRINMSAFEKVVSIKTRSNQSNSYQS